MRAWPSTSRFAGTCLLLLTAAGCQVAIAPVDTGRTDTPTIVVQPVDPLEKIFRETAVFSPHEAVADVARGEHASFQFAVRATARISDLTATASAPASDHSTLPAPWTGFVGYVKVGRSTPTPSRDRLQPASGYYPDPILDTPSIDIEPHLTQPVWISVPVPDSSRPGTYEGVLALSGRLDGKQFELERRFEVRVYSPVVDKSRLWVTNWFSVSPDRLAYMNRGEPVEPYSDTYWELVRVIASKMAEYRQNVAMISPLRLAQYTMSEGELQIDFSYFDRTVEIFIEEGVIGRIEGGHLGGRESTWTTPFVVSVPTWDGSDWKFVRLPVSDERSRAFYDVFLPSLVDHLRDRGWLDLYMQHLADEPIVANAASYVEIARYVKDLAPELRIVEAVHNKDLEGTINIWVPQLDFLHEDYEFYTSRNESADEVWFYTCLAPQGEYANRFIELPLIKTRLLHWINYRYGIPGYLHWGYNAWRLDPFQETTGIITESGNVLPGGDAWIVYPGFRRILSSIRLEAMRDGIVDYELLSRLEETHPEEVRELARRVVYQFDRYDMNIPAFRAKRRRVLQLLGKNTGNSSYN